MSNDRVRLDVDDGIGRITLDDPDRMNAMSMAMKRGLLDALAEVEASDARCVVIEGAGRAFSAGGDIDQMRERIDADPGEIMDDLGETIGLTNEITTTVFGFPVPVVALVDGPAVGAGAALTLASDVKLASDRAKVGFVFRHIGLSIDAGTSYLLPRVVGIDAAKELALTGRIVDAEEALDLGLLTRVYPAEEFDERAGEFVAEIADGPTRALGHIKRLINGGLEKSLDQALDDEAMTQSVLATSEDHREGVEAFLDDRDPEFVGR